jgi:hypothetical protein
MTSVRFDDPMNRIFQSLAKPRTQIHAAASLCFIVFFSAILTTRPDLPDNIDETVLLSASSVAMQDISNVLGPKKAAAALKIATEIDHYFIYDTRGGPRESTPPDLKEFFLGHVGECDTAVRLFIKMYKETTGESAFRQYDLISAGRVANNDPRYPHKILSGHSIAAMESARGSIGIDPTFGLLILTKESKFSSAMFHSGNYRIYRLYNVPTDAFGSTWPGKGITFFQNMSGYRSNGAFTGSDLVASSRIIDLDHIQTIIGTINNDGGDISYDQGLWMGHIGFLYTPGSHIWNFRTERAAVYNIIFHFVSDASSRQEIVSEIEIKASGTVELLWPKGRIRLPKDNLSVRVKAAPGQFNIAVSAEKHGFRLLDAIEVSQESDPLNERSVTELR